MGWGGCLSLHARNDSLRWIEESDRYVGVDATLVAGVAVCVGWVREEGDCLFLKIVSPLAESSR